LPFQTTGELYQAVVQYVLAKGAENSVAALKYGYPIGSWNVSRIKNFSSVFDGERNQALVDFDEDLSAWDVSQGTTMFRMFALCKNFTGRGLDSWQTSRVTTMQAMFLQASEFQGNVSGWDVFNVVSMARMFSDNHVFNANISRWNVSSVEDMAWMVSCDIDCSYFDDRKGSSKRLVAFSRALFRSIQLII
jgi:Mycoplasma protein of unknown function, DUF285